MSKLVYLIPLFPLISWAIIGLANRNLSKSLTGIIASGSVLASFVVAVLIFMEKLHNPAAETVFVFDWITVGDFSATMSFLIDPLSSIFLLVITGIGFLIHLYSTGYMHDDDGFRRFFAYLNLFVFFMLLLVLGNNFLIMFIGWEGVGLCSYLLIGFWFKNIDYSSAAKKAFIMNRIGDLGLLLGILMIYVTTHSVTFESVFSASGLSQLKADPSVVTAATMLLFIGAIGKSAQIPLYTWLPDAMAGPTPVSALIHAATMVTAGIYMVARCSAMFSLAPITMDVVAWTGTITALFAATIGFQQMDIKKVLAYSTVSQLGFMFAALGVGAFSSGVFHVVTHAFFKALLFLGAGSVIHGMSGEQDIRSMGGLKSKLPITHVTFLLGYLAIIGFPFFSGWYSKDEIIIKAFENKPIIGYLLIVGALMTAFYMSRVYLLTFWGKFRGTHEQEHHLHESPLSMTIPLMVLAALSVGGGFLVNGYVEHNLGGMLSDVKHAVENHSLHTMMWGVTAAVGVVVALAIRMYILNETPLQTDAQMAGFTKTVYNKYYVDEIYNSLITKPIDAVSRFLGSIFDTKVLDGVVNFFGYATHWLSSTLRRTQTGNVDAYFFAMVISIILILLFKVF
jgi:NADH-quinone oxidoreductase subunit L